MKLRGRNEVGYARVSTLWHVGVDVKKESLWLCGDRGRMKQGRRFREVKTTVLTLRTNLCADMSS
jgi:hypothetical protein